MTEEQLNKGMSLRYKINFAKQRVKDFMNKEEYSKDVLKKNILLAR